MASPRQWRVRLQPHPHLEDDSAYRQLRPTRLDEIKNFHSTDSIDTKNSGTRGRSIWVNSSQVGLLDSSMPHNSLPERVALLGTGVARNLVTEPGFAVRI